MCHLLLDLCLFMNLPLDVPYTLWIAVAIIPRLRVLCCWHSILRTVPSDIWVVYWLVLLPGLRLRLVLDRNLSFVGCGVLLGLPRAAHSVWCGVLLGLPQVGRTGVGRDRGMCIERRVELNIIGGSHPSIVLCEVRRFGWTMSGWWRHPNERHGYLDGWRRHLNRWRGHLNGSQGYRCISSGGIAGHDGCRNRML